MVECNEFVAEVIAVLRDFYSIAASVFIHPRQSRPCIRFPRINHVPHVLRLRHLTQVLDAVVESFAVDVIYLQRRKPPVVPSPDNVVRVEIIFTAIDG